VRQTMVKNISTTVRRLFGLSKPFMAELEAALDLQYSTAQLTVDVLCHRSPDGGDLPAFLVSTFGFERDRQRQRQRHGRLGQRLGLSTGFGGGDFSFWAAARVGEWREQAQGTDNDFFFLQKTMS
jgi:hypothetical protein